MSHLKLSVCQILAGMALGPCPLTRPRSSGCSPKQTIGEVFCNSWTMKKVRHIKLASELPSSQPFVGESSTATGNPAETGGYGPGKVQNYLPMVR